jgi:hypothetical protein
VLLADYPFLDIVWTMFIFFLFFTWLTILCDIFRRRDIVVEPRPSGSSS